MFWLSRTVDEAVFTTLDIVCPDILGSHVLNLKIDTEASGNTSSQEYQADVCKALEIAGQAY